MRIVFWNIMHGGGKRASAIIQQLVTWQPSLIALAEFRATSASQTIANGLSQRGYTHQITTASPKQAARNGLLLASSIPLRRVYLRPAPKPSHRWLMAEVLTKPKIHIAIMHIPNMHTKLKVPYHQQVLHIAQRWRRGAGLLIGDTNSGLPDIDEESPAFGKYEMSFMNSLDTLDWKDMFLQFHGQKREYTWYSPNGRNGFRLDEAFANKQLQPYITGFQHAWGQSDEHNQLSDHAAILLDTSLQV